MADPQSPKEWLALADQKIRAARLLHGDGQFQEAWNQMGHGVEATLKALIMHNLRLNSWPTVKEKPEFYSHHFEALAGLAGWSVQPTDEVAPAWSVVQTWSRGGSYEVDKIRSKVADQFLDAACGKNGVITWLKSNCLSNV